MAFVCARRIQVICGGPVPLIAFEFGEVFVVPQLRLVGCVGIVERSGWTMRRGVDRAWLRYEVSS